MRLKIPPSKHRESRDAKVLKRLRLGGQTLLLFLVTGMMLIDFGSGVVWRIEDAFYKRPYPVDTRLVLVGIDDQSLERIGPWPWSRQTLGDLVKAIDAGGPKVIGLDILLAEAKNTAEDAALIAALKSASAPLVLPAAVKFTKRSHKVPLEAGSSQYSLVGDHQIAPLPGLAQVATTAHINVIPDPDGIVRRVEPLIQVGDFQLKSFAHALARAGGGLGRDTTAWALGKWDMLIDFVGPSGSFAVLSAGDVLQGRISPLYFKNTYVIVGPTGLGLLEDRYLTAIDYQVPMTGIEIHANALQTLLSARHPRPLDFWMAAMTLLGLFGINLALHKAITYRLNVGASLDLAVKLGASLIVVLGYMTLLLAYNHGVLSPWRWPLVYPILGVALSVFYDQALTYWMALKEKQYLRRLFDQYVSKEVVDTLVALGRDALKLSGQRREVSVLFVDVRGFTPMCEALAPEAVVSLLNAYLTITAREIMANRGTVDKYIGDATMGLFNAPLESSHHCLDALLAALAICRAGKVQGHQSLAFGIGIHVGEAVVGTIGSTQKMEYTAIGDTVNTAARLESQAGPYQILISEAFYNRVADALSAYPQVKATPIEPLKLKGKTIPMRSYLVEEEDEVNAQTTKSRAEALE